MPLRNKVQRVSRTYGGFTGGWATERNEYSHDVIMREAMAWLEDRGDAPFFMYLAAHDSACQQRGHARHG